MSEYKSHSLNNLKDSIEDALTVDSPQEILDCILQTLKRNSEYHRVCARHSKEVLDLLHGIDRSKNVVEINASLNDIDYITNPKRWPDYTELPEIKVEAVSENTGMFTDDELLAKGYQLTDTGWVKI
tara:strand:+ start:195 stop:575 length:381 start_codon:yes stop_codon:yes gene_type:complete